MFALVMCAFDLFIVNTDAYVTLLNFMQELNPIIFYLSLMHSLSKSITLYFIFLKYVSEAIIVCRPSTASEDAIFYVQIPASFLCLTTIVTVAESRITFIRDVSYPNLYVLPITQYPSVEIGK